MAFSVDSDSGHFVIAAGLGLWLVLRILWRGFREERALDRTKNPWKS